MRQFFAAAGFGRASWSGGLQADFLRGLGGGATQDKKYPSVTLTRSFVYHWLIFQFSDFRFRSSDAEFQVSAFEFRISAFIFQILEFIFHNSVFGFQCSCQPRNSGFMFQTSGSNFQISAFIFHNSLFDFHIIDCILQTSQS